MVETPLAELSRTVARHGYNTEVVLQVFAIFR